jgi:hypothetical protein
MPFPHGKDTRSLQAAAARHPPVREHPGRKGARRHVSREAYDALLQEGCRGIRIYYGRAVGRMSLA